MLNKGLFLACTLALLSACDSSSVDKPATPQVATSQPAKPVQDVKVLAGRYAGRELSVVDVSEVQLDGASTLSVSFSVPLDPQQNFTDKLHLVDAKTELAAFGFVGGIEKLRLNRGGDVLRGPHLGDATFDPLGNAAALDRRVAVGDDGVAGRAQCIQHAGPGRIGIGFDIEDGANAGRVSPLLHCELAFAEADGGIAGILGDDAEGAARFAAQLAGQKRGVKANQAAIADLEAVGFDAKAGLEDRDHFTQLFQPTVGVLAPDLCRRLGVDSGWVQNSTLSTEDALAVVSQIAVRVDVAIESNGPHT